MRYISAVCVLSLLVPDIVSAGRAEPVQPPLRSIEQIPSIDGLYRETPKVLEAPKNLYSQNRQNYSFWSPVFLSNDVRRSVGIKETVEETAQRLIDLHEENQKRLRNNYDDNVYKASIVRYIPYYSSNNYSNSSYYRYDPRYDYGYWYGYDNYSPYSSYHRW